MNKLIYIFVLSLVFFSCEKPEPRKPILRKTGSYIEESVKRNKNLIKFEEKLLQLKMQKDSLNTYINSEYGFWYYYNKKDSLNNYSPVKGDDVIFSYQIKGLNDSIIYSKEELGDKRYLVDKEELITGLQEGIKLMHQGDIVTFLFPSHKAYGYTGDERIKSNEILIYTVELKQITKNKN
ncbi:MAG: gliding motility-associated peptidyl-prolyl isomerase GldI [Bacteroidota bacterium]